MMSKFLCMYHCRYQDALYHIELLHELERFEPTEWEELSEEEFKAAKTLFKKIISLAEVLDEYYGNEEGGLDDAFELFLSRVERGVK